MRGLLMLFKPLRPTCNPHYSGRSGKLQGEIPAFFLQIPTILSIRLWFSQSQSFAFFTEKRKTAAQDVPPPREKIPAGSAKRIPGGEKFRQNAKPPPGKPAAVRMRHKTSLSRLPPRPRSGSPAVRPRGQRRPQGQRRARPCCRQRSGTRCAPAARCRARRR